MTMATPPPLGAPSSLIRSHSTTSLSIAARSGLAPSACRHDLAGSLVGVDNETEGTELQVGDAWKWVDSLHVMAGTVVNFLFGSSSRFGSVPLPAPSATVQLRQPNYLELDGVLVTRKSTWHRVPSESLRSKSHSWVAYRSRPESSLGLPTMVLPLQVHAKPVHNAHRCSRTYWPCSASVQNEDLSTALSAYEITAHSACVVTVDLFCRVLCSIEIPVVLSEPSYVTRSFTPASITEPVSAPWTLALDWLSFVESSRAVVAAVERVVAGWVRLTVSGPSQTATGSRGRARLRYWSPSSRMEDDQFQKLPCPLS
ncbi:hypothetical protein C8J57DRAFT_1474412 [Mycena rebaudengoi]|nr:hypothetical protein C8J57DRAFT_1474412 [Mycena rebaudengoi]